MFDKTESVENAPDLWREFLPFPASDSHKYDRGTALVRGGALMTGASRLAARAAQRMGAGLVTLAVPACALPIYAAALESVIVRPVDSLPEWRALLKDPHHPALLIGPGLGASAAAAAEVDAVLEVKCPCVLDADALTSFSDCSERLFQNLHVSCVLTPHEGEFVRLFPGIDQGADKIARVRAAAKKAGCVVLLKGHETIIALPEGQVLVNRNAPVWLATAGSGDVLAGMILGLMAQKMPVFWAAAAAVWFHGRAGTAHGVGLIAEDIVDGIPQVLSSTHF